MNYRELLQKYKAGELPEEQRKQVRQDICLIMRRWSLRNR